MVSGVGVVKGKLGSWVGMMIERGAKVGVGPGVRVGAGEDVAFCPVASDVPASGTNGS